MSQSTASSRLKPSENPTASLLDTSQSKSILWGVSPGAAWQGGSSCPGGHPCSAAQGPLKAPSHRLGGADCQAEGGWGPQVPVRSLFEARGHCEPQVSEKSPGRLDSLSPGEPSVGDAAVPPPRPRRMRSSLGPGRHLVSDRADQRQSNGLEDLSKMRPTPDNPVSQSRCRQSLLLPQLSSGRRPSSAPRLGCRAPGVLSLVSVSRASWVLQWPGRGPREAIPRATNAHCQPRPPCPSETRQATHGLQEGPPQRQRPARTNPPSPIPTSAEQGPPCAAETASSELLTTQGSAPSTVNGGGGNAECRGSPVTAEDAGTAAPGRPLPLPDLHRTPGPRSPGVPAPPRLLLYLPAQQTLWHPFPEPRNCPSGPCAGTGPGLHRPSLCSGSP